MPVVHVDDLNEATKALTEASSPVVVVPVYNGFNEVVRCYESLFEHTPLEVTMLVIDDAGPDRRPVSILDDIAESIHHSVVLYHRQENGGFTRACNDAFAATAGRDVIIVNSDVVVGAEWLSRLSDAANSSPAIATASTLTNHGTMVSVPDRNRPSDRLPPGITADEAARRIAANSLRLRPTVPTAIGHCMYIKRAALDVVGGFDESFGTGYAEELDFSQRAVVLGFKHICADDVFTYHRGASSFGDTARAQKARNEALINVRYPWYPHWASRTENDQHSSLALAIDCARIALSGMTVGIDATPIGDHGSELEAAVLETIIALAEASELQRVHVYHTDEMSRSVQSILDELTAVERVSTWQQHPRGHRPDVMFRPCPVNSLDELRRLRAIGRRVVVNQLDTVAWANPSCFPSDTTWLQHRDLTRLVLGTADGIAFSSDFALREAAVEGLIPSATPTRVVYSGTTSRLDHTDADERRPTGLDDDGRPFLLAFSTAHAHENRAFAIELFAELRRRGWSGRLVLAGPSPPRAHSLGLEAETRLKTVAGRSVVALGDIADGEKRWLYERATLAIYPTVAHGLATVPFECARHGLAVLTSRLGSLDEVLPVNMPSLQSFDIAEAADLAWQLLEDESMRRSICDQITRQASTFTWQGSATELLALFSDVLRHAPNRTASVWGETAPIALDPPGLSGARSQWADRVERTLQRMLRAEGLKRSAIPADSRRQVAARRAANWVRRGSGAH